MDCYFRQSWTDTRLTYNASGLRILPVSVHVLNRLWKPDTHFFNGKHSSLHTVTTPNKLLRIHPDGRILYSMRFNADIVGGTGSNIVVGVRIDWLHKLQR